MDQRRTVCGVLVQGLASLPSGLTSNRPNDLTVTKGSGIAFSVDDASAACPRLISGV